VSQYRIVGEAGFRSQRRFRLVAGQRGQSAIGLMHLGGDTTNSGLATPIMRVLDHFAVDIA
jgi:hypothetical protein